MVSQCFIPQKTSTSTDDQTTTIFRPYYQVVYFWNNFCKHKWNFTGNTWRQRNIKKMQAASRALGELLVTAQGQNCLTIGIYESAKLLNVDPDCVVLCVLAADDDDEDDVALQIHFTLLQSFCCDNGITILRVSGIRWLKRLLRQPLVTMDTITNQEEHRDLHCLLVTNPEADHHSLQEVGTYCKESRSLNQWIPELVLQER